MHTGIQMKSAGNFAAELVRLSLPELQLLYIDDSGSQIVLKHLTLGAGHHAAEYIDRSPWQCFSDCYAFLCVSDKKFNATSRPQGLCDSAGTKPCLLYTSPSPRDKRQSRMPSSA